MLQILRSKTDTTNPDLKDAPRVVAGEDNLAWLKRADPLGVRIVLFGGRDHASFRLRIAQAHARTNMTASHWSHALLVLDEKASLGDAATKLVHAPLEPEVGHAQLLADNGAEEVAVGAFRSPKAFPNVAVLRIEVKGTDVESTLEAFRRQRATLDLVELSLAWLAFVCGVGKMGNPLLEGIGIPSAVLIESALGAAGFELTPSLPNRSSCPEGIWQAAKWWYGFHAQLAHAIRGAACIEHDLGAS